MPQPSCYKKIISLIIFNNQQKSLISSCYTFSLFFHLHILLTALFSDTVSITLAFKTSKPTLPRVKQVKPKHL